MACIKSRIAGGKFNAALGNTGVAVNNKGKSIGTRCCRFCPSRVNWGNTNTDYLKVELLVSRGGQSLELGHTISWGIDVDYVGVLRGDLGLLAGNVGGLRSESRGIVNVEDKIGFCSLDLHPRDDSCSLT